MHWGPTPRNSLVTDISISLSTKLKFLCTKLTPLYTKSLSLCTKLDGKPPKSDCKPPKLGDEPSMGESNRSKLFNISGPGS